MKEKIKNIKDRIFKSHLARNFLLIFSGEGISSVFGFLATIFIINAIGSYKHGILVAVQTYTNLFYGLFSFKTFQSLIKYLAKAEGDNDHESEKIYIKWAVMLDAFCLVATLFFGVILKDVVINIMGWDRAISEYCIFYLCVYMLYFQGTTIGVLRHFENYKYVVTSNISCAVIRCVGFLGCFVLRCDFKAFFLVDCIANAAKFLLMNFYTLKTLAQHKLLDFYKVKLKWCPDFLKFSLYSNLTSTIDLPVNQITSLIINKYLGFEATSVYSVFGNIGSVINKLGDPISQVIYPEMNKMISQKDVASARKLSNRLKLIMLSLFSVSTIFVVATHSLWLKYLISNPNEYVIPLILYIGYSCYSNSSMGTHNLFMALGYVKYNIPILIVVNAGYLGLLFFSVQHYGLTGVIATYLLQALAVVFIKEVIMRKRNYQEFM